MSQELSLHRLSTEILQGVSGFPIKSQLWRLRLPAYLPFRKFWINELELGAHLSRRVVPYVRNTVFSLYGRLQGVTSLSVADTPGEFSYCFGAAS